MTLKQFEKYLQMADPRLRIRVRGTGDVAGVFAGRLGRSGYICRISKGEIHLSGWRTEQVDPENPMKMIRGNIGKRGRKTTITLLRDWHWLKHHKDRSRLLWGLKH